MACQMQISLVMVGLADNCVVLTWLGLHGAVAAGLLILLLFFSVVVLSVLRALIMRAKIGSNLLTQKGSGSTVSRMLNTQALHLPASKVWQGVCSCLLYTSPSPRDGLLSRMPSSA